MTASTFTKLNAWLAGIDHRVIACSGGVDSMLLATVAHRVTEGSTTVVHDVTPAVTEKATARVADYATEQRWDLRLIASDEFDDERYLANPRNRCYFCKSHLYETMSRLSATLSAEATLLSGANVDDLGEYRPGLRAADEHAVRHPYVELGIAKADIRALARFLGLRFADLPASPCLASRLYTGTRVTARLLRAVEVGEEVLRRHTGVGVLRCRIDDSTVRVELPADAIDRAEQHVLDDVLRAMRLVEPQLNGIEVDPRGYQSGRAFELTVLP